MTAFGQALLPLALARGQAVLAVAVSASLCLGNASQEFVVSGIVEVLFRMAGDAKGVDLGARIHDIRRRAIPTRGPGFIGDVRIGLAVTAGAPDARLGMDHYQLFLDQI